jgi:hypothetical protein
MRRCTVITAVLSLPVGLDVPEQAPQPPQPPASTGSGAPSLRRKASRQALGISAQVA